MPSVTQQFDCSAIQHHVEWAVAERVIANQSPRRSDVAIHRELAEMHEQSAAAGVNQCLAPSVLSRPQEPRAF